MFVVYVKIKNVNILEHLQEGKIDTHKAIDVIF